MKKIDFLKASKIGIIVALIIAVVGAALLGIFGFNKGIELNGGYEMEVSVDVNFGDNKVKIENTVESILKEEGFKYEIEKVLDSGSVLIYQFRESAEESSSAFEDLAIKVENAVNDMLKANNSTLDATVKVNLASKYYGASDALWALLSIGISLVAIFVYMLIRYNWAYGLFSIILSVINVIVFLGLVGLTRAFVSPAILVLSVIAMVVSFISSVVFVADAKEKLKLNKDLDAKELANDLLNGRFAKNLFLAIAIIVLGILLLITGGTFTTIALLLIVFAVSNLLVSQLITGPLFVVFEKARIQAKSKKTYEKVEAEK